ncbi:MULTISPECIES: ImmA/IrrE family metallo-endopeptidase [unclassified Cryobacterium]|uniref:ImmA/IrrE family metallo-endopeptidase n=1 Tax=unclassified Cryobacterium TaxID=2649013 RepID=UPI002AB54711|nr:MULTISPECIES: ImmA/IrrE family metallo-endopeptidase [unclassified Cryobacterium]MDY7542655.1 ImmA/IrrE family metallo-endopeptidase [Cryobacterium sp. 5B3]MEB0264776.1 ImmA/IrrE family metallo-endopeptidase [Cryobacterium sp. 10I5]MEB0273748.1 ImmA/IrrE family metallo-endopeptidase [Cryobacterium sp. 5B3]
MQTTGRGYDPYEHADALGIDVVYKKLRTANGLWIPALKTICLQTRMRTIHERSVLTHEIGHVLLGHTDATPRQEVMADRWAARKLINIRELQRAALMTDDPGLWCQELNVSAKILGRYMKDRRAA